MFCSQCGQWAGTQAVSCAHCGAPLSAAASPQPAPHAIAAPVVAAVTAPAVRYGGFWRRLVALLVDLCVLYFPVKILRVLLGAPTEMTRLEDFMDPSWTAALLAQGALAWAYVAALESSPLRGTLGKHLLGLAVTDLKGHRISFLRASARWWGRLLSELLCMTGYLFNLWTPKRQALHDLLSGCVVVRPSPAPAAVATPAHAGEARP